MNKIRMPGRRRRARRGGRRRGHRGRGTGDQPRRPARRSPSLSTRSATRTSTSVPVTVSRSAPSSSPPTPSCKAASRSAVTGRAAPSPRLSAGHRRRSLPRRPRPGWPDRPGRAGPVDTAGTRHLPGRGHRRHRQLPGRPRLRHRRARPEPEGHRAPHLVTITAPDRAQGRHLATRSGRIPAISPPHRHELHRQELIPPLGARQFRWDQPVTSAPRRASCGQGRTLNSAPNRAICTLDA